MIFYNMQKETVHHFYLMYSFFFLLLHNYLRFLRKSGIWISFFCTVLDGTLVPNEEFIVGILNVGIFIPAEDEVLPVEAGLLTLNGDELLPPRPAGLDDASVRPVAITVMRA